MEQKCDANEIKYQVAESLEAIAHWMRTSSFDYKLQHLKSILEESLYNYQEYLIKKSSDDL